MAITRSWVRVVLTCVGSLTRAVIRLAGQPEATTFDGKREIVSLVGTLALDGDHLHIAVSDSTGRTIGGPLMEGSLVYTCYWCEPTPIWIEPWTASRIAQAESHTLTF